MIPRQSHGSTKLLRDGECLLRSSCNTGGCRRTLVLLNDLPNCESCLTGKDGPSSHLWIIVSIVCMRLVLIVECGRKLFLVFVRGCACLRVAAAVLYFVHAKRLLSAYVKIRRRGSIHCETRVWLRTLCSGEKGRTSLSYPLMYHDTTALG